MPFTVAWARRMLQSTMGLRLLAAVDGAGCANYFRALHHFSDVEGGIELVVNAVYLFTRPIQSSKRTVEILQRSHFFADRLGVGDAARAAHGFKQHAGAVIEGRAEAIHGMLVVGGIQVDVGLGRR